MTATYNKFETYAARVLDQTPTLKAWVKHIYSRCGYRFHKKPYVYKSLLPVSAVSCDSSKESFFGYYDKSPASPTGVVLYHCAAGPTNIRPDPDIPIEIRAYSQTMCKEIPIKTFSFAYNWQQGTRLHWLDNDTFIFNDVDRHKARYIARVFSVSSGQETRRFSHPVQDSFGKRFFLSLNYRRLQAMRPDYGYGNLPSLSDGEIREYTNDGIWRVDYASGQGKLIISLDKIIRTQPNHLCNKARHKINHIMISPSGNRFIFIHRYYINKKRYDRLMLADARGKAMTVLAANTMVSHCAWIDEDTVLGYMRNNEGTNGYWLIDLGSNTFTQAVGGRINPYGDGHPHVHGDWFVTDTYPDKARMQHLILCNWKIGEIIELGQFFHGFAYRDECRCDLHPRFSQDGKTIFFDSVCDGKRKMYQMDISSIICNR